MNLVIINTKVTEVGRKNAITECLSMFDYMHAPIYTCVDVRLHAPGEINNISRGTLDRILTCEKMSKQLCGKQSNLDEPYRARVHCCLAISHLGFC